MSNTVTIFAPDSDHAVRADALAAHLSASVSHSAYDIASDELALLFDDNGLSLVCGKLAVRGDFGHMAKRIAPSNLPGELLVRAAKTKAKTQAQAGSGSNGPTAIDATAGLGEDSLLLAAAGYSVTLFERNPVIAALLRDALDRAAKTPGLAEPIARMRLVEADSEGALATMELPPDIVLLDPMFPERRKSASVKKKLQLLQQLELPCEDEAALLNAAFAAQPLKVVVKRPAKGPFLANRKPSYSLAGKAVRYDCYVTARSGRVAEPQ